VSIDKLTQPVIADSQGDQIEQISAVWAIVYFRQFVLKNTHK
jgi:hypothetical protein